MSDSPQEPQVCRGCGRPFQKAIRLQSILETLFVYPDRSLEDTTRCTTCIAVGDLIQ